MTFTLTMREKPDTPVLPHLVRLDAAGLVLASRQLLACYGRRSGSAERPRTREPVDRTGWEPPATRSAPFPARNPQRIPEVDVASSCQGWNTNDKGEVGRRRRRREGEKEAKDHGTEGRHGGADGGAASPSPRVGLKPRGPRATEAPCLPPSLPSRCCWFTPDTGLNSTLVTAAPRGRYMLPGEPPALCGLSAAL